MDDNSDYNFYNILYKLKETCMSLYLIMFSFKYFNYLKIKLKW